MPRGRGKKGGRGRGRGRMSTENRVSTENMSESDVESKRLRLSPDVSETGDEKDNNQTDEYEETPLNSTSTDSGSRRTSMRKCKEQTLQKRQENIKKREEDRLLEPELAAALSFSSDDEADQMDDDSDLDPVWTPADKVESSKAAQSAYADGTPKRRASRVSQTKISPSRSKPSSIVLEHNEQTSPISITNESDKEDKDIEIQIIDTKDEKDMEEKMDKKSKVISSYKYTQSSHIIEGHFKPGNFVMAIADKDKPSPPLWRIEGKSLLQRFESYDDHGRILYRNSSSYSAWNSTTMYKYIGVNVLLVSHNRNSSIVENLGPIENEEHEVLKIPQPPQGQQLWIYSYPGTPGSGAQQTGGNDGNQVLLEEEITHPQQENFEVFLQTLISQVLDPNFISEIIKENDDYFLSHIKGIENVTEETKKKIFTFELDEQVKNMIEIFPSVNVLPNTDKEGANCLICKDNKAHHVLQYQGKPYDPTSLGWKEVPTEQLQLDAKYYACASCASSVVLYSRLHHHKYSFFLKCKKKVEDVKNSKQDKESHMLLEECLQDTVWLTQMFQEIKDLWSSCDKLR